MKRRNAIKSILLAPFAIKAAVEIKPVVDQVAPVTEFREWNPEKYGIYAQMEDAMKRSKAL